MIDIELKHASVFGDHFYQLWVDGVQRDFFATKIPLTWSEMDDVVAGYREALDFEE